ncbi:MAG TPA: DNA-binding protein [Nitrososphaerales archaeon]|nr:DNA-binding protein [Nitrososphaerales archaeon]
MSDEGRSNSSDRQKAAEQEKQAKVAREQMLRVIFTSEARERLNNLRMVKPDQVDMIENQVFQLAAAGRLRKQIDDEELKQMLGQMQKPKREFKINWK